LPWKESLKQLCDLGLKEEVTRKLLRENAIELFKLEPSPSSLSEIPTQFAERYAEGLRRSRPLM
jgi:hypothetical protein